MRIFVSEMTIATFRQRQAVHRGSTPTSGSLRVDPPADKNGHFPADGVAFRMSVISGGPAPDVSVPETRFPLRLADFQPSDMYASGSPRPVQEQVVADGRNYLALAWIGPQASRSARRELQQIVASLAFPRLNPGSQVGNGFTVLPRASHYPVGSFTRVTAQHQPFYLVHAPGGFYALGWKWQSVGNGYKSDCQLRLDRRRREFFCTNLHARWDRIGRVITRPTTASFNDPLNATVAKPSWDGHILLFPGEASFLDAAIGHHLWPGWHEPHRR